MRTLRRKVERFRKRFSARRSRGMMVNTEDQLGAASTPADVSSPRAKSQRHGKSTADKWNR